jgi:hypothetical protein
MSPSDLLGPRESLMAGRYCPCSRLLPEREQTPSPNHKEIISYGGSQKNISSIHHSSSTNNA